MIFLIVLPAKSATENLEEERWGFWLKVLNEERIQIPVQNKDVVVPYAPQPLKRTWDVEGKVMLVVQGDGSGGVRKWTLAFDEEAKHLVESFDDSTARLIPQSDGSFIAQDGDVRVTLRYKPDEHSIHSVVEVKPEKDWIVHTHTIELPVTQENKTAAQQAIAVLVQINQVNRTNKNLMARMGYQSEEQMMEATKRLQQEHREYERKKEEASRRRWEMFAQGMGAIAQAAADTSRAYAVQRAQTQALNQRIENANALAAANERERVVANQGQLKQQQQAQPQMRSLATSTQTNSANNSARTVNMSSASSSSSQKASNLRATPEAITVCTNPGGANGSFECRSPVTVKRGHKNDISGHRTPDEMVMNMDGCPSPRRLASTTHLVWGCGFGATNNSNSMDRSAGVDVKGRNTYYCHEKETSCRRTTP
ncbi:hypothetical protein GCM10027343_33560 [Noviherbaspirillum agri]